MYLLRGGNGGQKKKELEVQLERALKEAEFWKAELDHTVDEKNLWRDKCITAQRQLREMENLKRQVQSLREEKYHTGKQYDRALQEIQRLRAQLRSQGSDTASGIIRRISSGDDKSRDLQVTVLEERVAELQNENDLLHRQNALLRASEAAFQQEAKVLREELRNQNGINEYTAEETTKLLLEISKLQQANVQLQSDVLHRDEVLRLFQQQMADQLREEGSEMCDGPSAHGSPSGSPRLRGSDPGLAHSSSLDALRGLANLRTISFDAVLAAQRKLHIRTASSLDGELFSGPLISPGRGAALRRAGGSPGRAGAGLLSPRQQVVGDVDGGRSVALAPLREEAVEGGTSSSSPSCARGSALDTPTAVLTMMSDGEEEEEEVEQQHSTDDDSVGPEVSLALCGIPALPEQQQQPRRFSPHAIPYPPQLHFTAAELTQQQQESILGLASVMSCTTVATSPPSTVSSPPVHTPCSSRSSTQQQQQQPADAASPKDAGSCESPDQACSSAHQLQGSPKAGLPPGSSSAAASPCKLPPAGQPPGSEGAEPLRRHAPDLYLSVQHLEVQAALAGNMAASGLAALKTRFQAVHSASGVAAAAAVQLPGSPLRLCAQGAHTKPARAGEAGGQHSHGSAAIGSQSGSNSVDDTCSPDTTPTSKLQQVEELAEACEEAGQPEQQLQQQEEEEEELAKACQAAAQPEQQLQQQEEEKEEELSEALTATSSTGNSAEACKAAAQLQQQQQQQEEELDHPLTATGSTVDTAAGCEPTAQPEQLQEQQEEDAALTVTGSMHSIEAACEPAVQPEQQEQEQQQEQDAALTRVGSTGSSAVACEPAAPPEPAAQQEQQQLEEGRTVTDGSSNSAATCEAPEQAEQQQELQEPPTTTTGSAGDSAAEQTQPADQPEQQPQPVKRGTSGTRAAPAGSPRAGGPVIKVDKTDWDFTAGIPQRQAALAALTGAAAAADHGADPDHAGRHSRGSSISSSSAGRLPKIDVGFAAGIPQRQAALAALTGGAVQLPEQVQQQREAAAGEAEPAAAAISIMRAPSFNSDANLGISQRQAALAALTGGAVEEQAAECEQLLGRHSRRSSISSREAPSGSPLSSAGRLPKIDVGFAAGIPQRQVALAALTGAAVQLLDQAQQQQQQQQGVAAGEAEPAAGAMSLMRAPSFNSDANLGMSQRQAALAALTGGAVQLSEQAQQQQQQQQQGVEVEEAAPAGGSSPRPAPRVNLDFAAGIPQRQAALAALAGTGALKDGVIVAQRSAEASKLLGREGSGGGAAAAAGQGELRRGASMQKFASVRGEL